MKINNILTTINAQTNISATLDQLANSIKNEILPADYLPHIINLFMDCSIRDISEFGKYFDISDSQLKNYYELFIKGYYTNTDLEEMLSYVDKLA